MLVGEVEGGGLDLGLARDREGAGVEVQAIGWRGAVGGVAEDREAEPGEVDAGLVAAAGVEGELAAQEGG